MSRPTNATVAGRAYLAVRREAKAAGAAWRARLQLTELLPNSFAEVLDAVIGFADPALTGAVADTVAWDPAGRIWYQSS